MFNTQQKSLSWADCNLRWTLSENNKHAKPCKYINKKMKTKIYTGKRRRVEKPQRQQLFIENFFCVPRQFSVKFPHHRGRRRCLSFMWQRTSRGKLIQPQKELFSIMSWCSTTASYCFSHSLSTPELRRMNINDGCSMKTVSIWRTRPLSHCHCCCCLSHCWASLDFLVLIRQNCRTGWTYCYLVNKDYRWLAMQESHPRHQMNELEFEMQPYDDGRMTMQQQKWAKHQRKCPNCCPTTCYSDSNCSIWRVIVAID